MAAKPRPARCSTSLALSCSFLVISNRLRVRRLSQRRPPEHGSKGRSDDFSFFRELALTRVRLPGFLLRVAHQRDPERDASCCAVTARRPDHCRPQTLQIPFPEEFPQLPPCTGGAINLTRRYAVERLTTPHGVCPLAWVGWPLLQRRRYSLSLEPKHRSSSRWVFAGGALQSPTPTTGRAFGTSRLGLAPTSLIRRFKTRCVRQTPRAVCGRRWVACPCRADLRPASRRQIASNSCSSLLRPLSFKQHIRTSLTTFTGA